MKHVSKPAISQIAAAPAVALLHEVGNHKLDAAGILRRARIPYSLADIRDGKVASLARHHFSALCRECITALEQHASQQGVYPPMHQAEFEMLCYCVINCKTLAEAIERAASFCRMLNGRAGELMLERREADATFTMKTFRGKQTTSALLADLLGLTAYHRLFSWLIGETISIGRASSISSSDTGGTSDAGAMAVVYPELIGADTVFDLFHYSIRFDAASNHFEFAARYLDKPVVRSYQELLQLLRFFPFDLFTTDLQFQRLDEALHTLIKGALLKHEPAPTIAQLASLFNVSQATLRRRLDEEQTSITAIKEKCRYELANELLHNRQNTLEEIADKLGFSDAGAFRRAFKTWTGVTPSEYRAQLQ
ncbi:MAG TPA: helix-turn-helix domain-containing protein [Spongiibacteraceae bacterium]|nr:helix-turn-helix domain-containing protein [Spongiibacteraceae bacterium]